MKQVWRLGTAVLGLLSCVSGWSAPYPTADQLRNAIAEITPQLKSEQMDVVMLDAQKEGIELPLMAAGLRLGDGVCIVYYNAKPEEGLVQFFEPVSAPDMPIWLNSIAAHEITHCIEQREAYIRRRFERVLPPGVAHENVTVQGYYSVVKSGAVENWGEALADIVSVLYLKQAVPDRWQQFAGTLAAMRSSQAGKWPEHNTSAWLNKVIAAGADKPEHLSLFEAAFQLRRQFQPEQTVHPQHGRASQATNARSAPPVLEF